MTRSSLGRRRGVLLSERTQLAWVAVFAISVALGVVTLAFVMMKHDLNQAISLLQHRLDNGWWKQIILCQWHRPDIASLFVGLVFFSLLWLVPAATIRHYTADARRGLLCLATICFLAACLVLLFAIGSFTIVYCNTEVVTNALSWSSVWAAGIAACVLLFCSILLVLGHRGAPPSGPAGPLSPTA